MEISCHGFGFAHTTSIVLIPYCFIQTNYSNPVRLAKSINASHTERKDSQVWVLQFFQSGPSDPASASEPDVPPTSPRPRVPAHESPHHSAARLHRQLNVSDYPAFVNTAMENSNDNNIFSSTHSIGFSRLGLQSGGAIFAIDGVRAPSILRKTDTQQYRVMSDCYL